MLYLKIVLVIVIRCISLSLSLSLSLSAFAEPQNSFDFGIGTGARYAGRGISSEYHLNDSVGIAAGIGTIGDFGWTTGVNYYLNSREYRTRYRLSLNYGITAEITCDDCPDDRFDEEFQSFSVGIGFVMEHFEFSIFRRDMHEFNDREEELESMGGEVDSASNTYLSFGYIF
jgi:hypothetical protein